MIQPYLQKYRQIILFFLIGIINTLFGYLIFSLLIFMKVHYTVAILMATVLGVIFSFNTMGKFVFQNRKKSFFIKFLLVYGALYFLNLFLVKALNVSIKNLYIDGAISTGIIAIISFFLNKYFVFKRK